MTRKQIKKYAAQILALEKIHQDKNSSDKQKYDAEQKIMQLTNMINSLPQGINILLEIDDIIQNQATKEKSLENKEN